MTVGVVGKEPESTEPGLQTMSYPRHLSEPKVETGRNTKSLVSLKIVSKGSVIIEQS